MPEMVAVAAATPLLVGEAARRAAAALAERKSPAPIDLAARQAEFFNLMAGAWQPAQGWA
jgi:hypothetical protein